MRHLLAVGWTCALALVGASSALALPPGPGDQAGGDPYCDDAPGAGPWNGKRR
jgi:hypothetical protein